MINTKKKKLYLNKTRKNKDLSLIKNENTRFEHSKNKKLIKTLSNEFKKRMIHNTKTIPSQLNKYSYYHEIRKGENYSKYYIIDHNNNHICILDLDTIGKKHAFFNVSCLYTSNNEKFAVFSVDIVGNRYHNIYIKDFFNDKIELILHNVEGEFVISPDSTCIYYLEMNNSMRANKVYCYNIHNKKKKCIFSENNESFSLTISLSNNRNHILVSSLSWESSHVYQIVNNHCKLLYKKEKDLNYNVLNYLDEWYIIYIKNNVSKIISTKDFKNYNTLLPNKANTEYLNCIIKGHYLCCIYKKLGYYHLLTIDLISKKTKYIKISNKMIYIDFPSLSNLDICNPKLIFNVYGNLFPQKVVELNCVTNELKELKSYKITNYDESNYEEKLIHVNKELCVTMLYKKDKLKKNMSCLLKGYGAYGENEYPYFDPKVISLLNRGFLHCTAHIRGGGFHGKGWYDEGKLLHKMNTFNDFIECSKYLIKNNYTNKDKLAIWGRSAGGLLIGAVLNMKPELYKLAILGVPFVDVLNTMKDDSKPLTTEEYKEWGNPHNKKYETYIKKYDPMLNIDTNKDYPNIFIYSNFNDTLVSYKEPLKYYLKIKEANVFKNKEKDIFLNINLKYGHTQSSKRYESVDEEAIYYAMIIDKLRI
jgi:oligopeptidase B